MIRQCRKCGRAVPVFPGFQNTVVAHVAVKAGTTFEPCQGSNKNVINSLLTISLVPDAEMLARQYANLEAAGEL